MSVWIFKWIKTHVLVQKVVDTKILLNLILI